MKEEADIEGRRAIAEQAALWMLTLQSTELSLTQRTEFVGWLRASPQHVAEMLRICSLHRNLKSHQGWTRRVPLDLEHSANIFYVRGARAPRQGGVCSTAPRRMVRSRAAWLIAACVAALCVLGPQVRARLDQEEFKTGLGERRELTLADGSLAQLAPDSDIVVRFHQRERQIELKHGEATFHVARNPNRPFIVKAGLTHVLAVGTVFNVVRGEQAVCVEVVEGRVAVSQHPATHLLDFTPEPVAPVVSLGADERVSVTPSGTVSSVRRVEHTGATGPDSGELVFENQTIAEIARRFNLRNRLYIDVVSPQLGDRRVSGVFRADDPHSFVDFIRATSGARVAQPDPTHITLSLPVDERGDSAR